MKLQIILTALFLGILIGLTISEPHPTGAATCYLENQKCQCTEQQCNCGNQTIPADYCTTETLNTNKK